MERIILERSMGLPEVKRKINFQGVHSMILDRSSAFYLYWRRVALFRCFFQTKHSVNGLTSSHIRLFSLSCTGSHILSVANVSLAQTSPLFDEV
jgi:hypothetical protein